MLTALVLTPEQEKKRRQVLARLQEAATTLKTRFGVRRVILFGSLAHASSFTPGSDVALAVEGLDTKNIGRPEGKNRDRRIMLTKPNDGSKFDKKTNRRKQALVLSK